MTRYHTSVLFVSGIVLALFIVKEIAYPAMFADYSAVRHASLAATGLLSVLLLTADVLLPVPASIIMLSNGVVFGSLVGALLSLLGATGSALLGFAIGRAGGPLLARITRDADLERAHAFFARWGALAVLMSRPLPILSETVALFAGASKMPLRNFLFGALVGNAPVCLALAIAGAAATPFAIAAAIALAATLTLAGAGFAIVWWTGSKSP